MRANELGSYIKLLRIKNNMTMTQTAGITGITQGYISQIENGIYTPSAKTLSKLARAYNVPEIHLLRKAGIVQAFAPGMGRAAGDGHDRPLELDPLLEVSDSRELMDMLRRGISNLEYITSQLRQRGSLSSLPPASAGDGGDSALRHLPIPVYESSWQPLAGFSGDEAGMLLPSSFCNDDETSFILNVDDNSMFPLVSTGDWVVVSPQSPPENGCIVAINERNLIKLRSYTEVEGMLALVPVNTDYADATLLLDDSHRGDVELIGRVLRVVNREL